MSAKASLAKKGYVKLKANKTYRYALNGTKKHKIKWNYKLGYYKGTPKTPDGEVRYVRIIIDGKTHKIAGKGKCLVSGGFEGEKPHLYLCKPTAGFKVFALTVMGENEWPDFGKIYRYTVGKLKAMGDLKKLISRFSKSWGTHFYGFHTVGNGMLVANSGTGGSRSLGCVDYRITLKVSKTKIKLASSRVAIHGVELENGSDQSFQQTTPNSATLYRDMTFYTAPGSTSVAFTLDAGTEVQAQYATIKDKKIYIGITYNGKLGWYKEPAQNETYFEHADGVVPMFYGTENAG
jgi:hypothetical protein